MKTILSTTILFFSAFALFAQTSPRTYPGSRMPEADYVRYLDNLFPELTIGLLHVYALDDSQIDDTYLLTGNPFPAEFTKSLPGRFRRMARKGEAYAAAALAGSGENLYLVRFTDTRSGDRLDLFTRQGNRLKHLTTLAMYDCTNRGCRQLDGYLTDFDGDGVFDIARRARLIDTNGQTEDQMREYFILNDDHTLSKTTAVSDELARSFEFHEMSRR